MPDPTPTADELHAQANAVVQALGEGWGHEIDGKVLILVGPVGGRHRYDHGSPFWRRAVELAGDPARRRIMIHA